MQITRFLAAQLERELPISRRVLERVPARHTDWKPHERSMALGYLGTLCHAAHHRGQLTVYLRLLGEKVPSIYGPSADDRVF